MTPSTEADFHEGRVLRKIQSYMYKKVIIRLFTRKCLSSKVLTTIRTIDMLTVYDFTKKKKLELKKCEQRFYVERKKVTCFHECLWE